MGPGYDFGLWSIHADNNHQLPLQILPLKKTLNLDKVPIHTASQIAVPKPLLYKSTVPHVQVIDSVL